MAFENHFETTDWLERWKQEHDSEDRFPYGPPVSAHLNFRQEMLITPFRYLAECGKSVTAPTYFIHDFASVPRLFWRIVGKTEAAIAAVSHDWIFVRQCYDDGTPIKNHIEAAHLMREIMDYVCEPHTAFQRWVAYQGTTTFIARYSWDNNRKDLVNAGLLPAKVRSDVHQELLKKH